MLPIGANTASNQSVQTLLGGKKDDAVDAAKPDANPASVASKTAEGVVVTISSAAFQASKTQSNPNQDIDDSNLKDNIKQLLKMIRELKKQLAEKMAELSATMADTSLSPEARQAKVANLQAAVSALQGGLATAQTQLAKAMKDEPPEAQLQAMSLAMK